MLKVAIRPRAQLDLESIYIHIAVVLGSPTAANQALESLYAAIERLAEFPTLGKDLKDDDLARPYRRMLCKSYWVYYTFSDDELIVWRIFHTSQDIDDYTYVDL
ncbi:MAG: type II toxin-antitoxin system RelE/ParE family toxin [Coriobacteriaceae bacterium]|nr:type II toxin-antitoxin system RelE/ParE family toxin [Coriobacteriaceae bacterium]MDO4891366.1 type II toxin-antitoxin system RelE/ParE family toxin [Coriobacteriaceae bacterium]